MSVSKESDPVDRAAPRGGKGPDSPTDAAPKRSKAEACQVLPLADHDRWDEFVLSPGHGTLFHTAWWYRAWGMQPTVQALCDAQGKIQAGICYAMGRRWGLRSIVRPPMTPRNGPVFAPLADAGRHRQHTHHKKMTSLAIGALPRLAAYDFILRPDDADVMPFLWNGFDTLIVYTYVVPRTERDTWIKHASKTQQRRVRTAARHAEEEQYGFEPDPDFGEVLALLKATAEAKRYSMARFVGSLPAWWREVQARQAGSAYLLRDGAGRPACAALMVYDSQCAYYLGGGIRSDLRSGSIVNVLLFHRMIQDAHAQGLDFDFEGSVLPGVEGFFRSLGGELRPLYRVVKLPSLVSYLIWSGYRYLKGHRKRAWIVVD